MKNIYKIEPTGRKNQFDVYVLGQYHFTGTWEECRNFVKDDEQYRVIQQPSNIDPILVKLSWALIVAGILMIMNLLA